MWPRQGAAEAVMMKAGTVLPHEWSQHGVQAQSAEVTSAQTLMPMLRSTSSERGEALESALSFTPGEEERFSDIAAAWLSTAYVSLAKSGKRLTTERSWANRNQIPYLQVGRSRQTANAH